MSATTVVHMGGTCPHRTSVFAKSGVKYLASPLVLEERQDKGSGRSSDRKGVFHTNKCELISLTRKANVEGLKYTSQAKIS